MKQKKYISLLPVLHIYVSLRGPKPQLGTTVLWENSPEDSSNVKMAINSFPQIVQSFAKCCSHTMFLQSCDMVPYEKMDLDSQQRRSRWFPAIWWRREEGRRWRPGVQTQAAWRRRRPLRKRPEDPRNPGASTTERHVLHRLTFLSHVASYDRLLKRFRNWFRLQGLTMRMPTLAESTSELS